MRSTRRRPSSGVIKNTLIILLVVIELSMLFVFNNKCIKYKDINTTLKRNVNYHTNTINNLRETIDGLNNKILYLEEEKNSLLKERDQLKNNEINLNEDIDNLNKEIERLSSILSEAQTNHKDFKSYMDYTAITDRTSRQWNLQQKASTNENGFRCIDGRPLVAVGTGWGLTVGDYATVYCANGNSFEVVVGDIKSNAHTLSDNKTTASNNCRCEFIVDMKNLNPTVKNRGSVSILQEYSGYVIDIK